MKSLHPDPQISGLSPGADVSTLVWEQKQEAGAALGEADRTSHLYRDRSTWCEQPKDSCGEGSSEESHANVTLTPSAGHKLWG